jgi:hypothetical protein
MQGMLTLSSDPQTAFHAATKQYVDTHNATIYAGGAVNVLAFGADPAGAVDSTAAFNAAASQIAPNGQHKSVFVPAGYYKINGQITLSGSQTLMGDGRGNTFLVIDQNFSKTASSIILCGPSADYGVTICSLSILFYQPTTVTSRATFKTLAAGGTSVEGGTGVQYPWAIYGPAGSGRIKVQNVQIRGAWNGFLFDTVFWIDNIEMGAIGTGLGQAINNSVLDWNFIGTYESWPYGWNYPGQNNIFMDGQTIAIQCGSPGNSGFQTGIMGQSIANFTGRIIFYGSGWSTITNLNNDGDTSSLEVYGQLFLEITNFYYSSGSSGIRPGITLSGADTSRLFIHNIYSHSSSNYPIVSISGNSEMHIVDMFMIYYPLTVSAILVNSGVLSISGGRLVGGAGTHTAPLINNVGGNLIVGDGLMVSGTGIGVRFQADNAGNYLGELLLDTDTTISLPATVTAGNYGSAGLRASTSYANDAAAAAGGVKVGRLYRNGSAVMIRIV